MIRNPFRSKEDKQPRGYVLVVGDDPFTGEVIDRFLREDNFATYLINNLPEALEVLEKTETIHLIIGDFTQPQIDGKNFLQRARIRVGRQDLPPVVFIMDTPEDELTANEMEVADLLPKPIQREALLSCVHRLVEKPSAAAV